MQSRLAENIISIRERLRSRRYSCAIRGLNLIAQITLSFQSPAWQQSFAFMLRCGNRLNVPAVGYRQQVTYCLTSSAV
jgi:hypothetical protein